MSSRHNPGYGRRTNRRNSGFRYVRKQEKKVLKFIPVSENTEEITCTQTPSEIANEKEQSVGVNINAGNLGGGVVVNEKDKEALKFLQNAGKTSDPMTRPKNPSNRKKRSKKKPFA
jgi:hypothetical protein